MTTNRNNLTLAACLCAMWLVAGLAGCAHNRVTAYKTLATIAQSVDTAMQSYADLTVTGKIPPPTQEKVRQLKSQYEAAFLAAAKAAQVNLGSPAPQDLQSIADSLVNLIRTLH